MNFAIWDIRQDHFKSMAWHIKTETKWPPIFQTRFSNAFSWMKIYEFWLRFHRILFLRVQLTISQHWFRRQAIIWTSDGLFYWRLYVPLGLDELMQQRHNFRTITMELRLFCIKLSIAYFLSQNKQYIVYIMGGSWHNLPKVWLANFMRGYVMVRENRYMFHRTR